MDAVFQSILSGAPFLLLHAGVTIAMLVAGVTLYMWMTPYEDIGQIRAGNGAAGIALAAKNRNCRSAGERSEFYQRRQLW